MSIHYFLHHWILLHLSVSPPAVRAADKVSPADQPESELVLAVGTSQHWVWLLAGQN